MIFEILLVLYRILREEVVLILKMTFLTWTIKDMLYPNFLFSDSLTQEESFDEQSVPFKLSVVSSILPNQKPIEGLSLLRLDAKLREARSFKNG